MNSWQAGRHWRRRRRCRRGRRIRRSRCTTSSRSRPAARADIAARFQQAVWRKKFGQELVVESKPGAGGALAWSLLNSFPGDGYTVMGTNLPHLVLQPLEGNVQLPDRRHHQHHLLQLHARRDRRAQRVALQDVQGSRGRDEGEAGTELNFAGSGTNSANHAAHERLDHELGTKTTYVPFKGTGDLIASLLGGHVDVAMSYSSLARRAEGQDTRARGGHAAAPVVHRCAHVPRARHRLGRRRLSRHRRAEVHARGAAQAPLGHLRGDQPRPRVPRATWRARASS